MRTSNHFLIWLYFTLIVAEGPLRKWITPGLSEPLLIIRDPVVILIYIIALKDGRFPVNGWVIGNFFLGLMSVVLCGLLQGVPGFVMAYGFRTLFLHLPLIFVIPMYLNRNNIIIHGTIVMLLMIPQAALMAMQFTAPQEHILNVGAAGSIGTQMEGAMGKTRPPGLFSFITGAAQFIPFVTAFVLHGLITRKYYPRLLLYGAGLLIFIGLIVSISRLAIGSTLVVLAMLLIVALAIGGRQLKVMFRILLPLILLGFVVSQLKIFEEGSEVMSARLERTGDLQVGLSGTALNWNQRYFNDLTAGLFAIDDVQVFGNGLGMGTNVGARYTTGKLQFTIAEGEWGRIVGELGPIVGLLVIAFRVLLSLSLLKAAFRALQRGNLLPIFLWGACGMLIINGQWGQSTTLGFTVWIAGVMLAACRVPETEARR